MWKEVKPPGLTTIEKKGREIMEIFLTKYIQIGAQLTAHRLLDSVVVQDLDMEQLAEMPSCNLAEIVHNKWLQMSGNRGFCLYVATEDNMLRAMMQSTNTMPIYKVIPQK